jgi:phage gp36-like protein
MGNYITRADVDARLRRNYDTLYTRDGAVDTAVVDADIAAAEAEVDGHLAQRYAVPVTAAGALPLLKHWALTLLEDLAYGAIPGREVPKHITARVEAVRKQLASAAEGKLSLGAATVPDERPAAAENLLVDGAAPEFQRSDLEAW